MPARQEYLSTTGQRILKITAGFFGGYMLSLAIHLFIAAIFPTLQADVMLTAAYLIFFLWAVFMIIAFMAKSGWRIWGIYLSCTIILGAIIYLLK